MLPDNSHRRPFLPSCPQCGTVIRTLRELHSQAARCTTCADRWQRAVEVRREQRYAMEALLSAQRAALEPSVLLPVIPPGFENEVGDAGESGNLLPDANVRQRDPTTAFARFQQCMPPPLVPTIQVNTSVNVLAMLARSKRTYPQQTTSSSTQTTPRPAQGSSRSDNLTLPEEQPTGSQTTQNQNTFKVPKVPKRAGTPNSVARVETVQLPTSDERSNNPGRDVPCGSRTAEEVASAIARCNEQLMPSLPINNVENLTIRRQLITVEEESPNEDIADNQSVLAPTECIQTPEQCSTINRASTIVSGMPPMAQSIQDRDMSPMPRDSTTTAQPQPASNSSSQSAQDTQASEANKEGPPTTEPKTNFNDDKQT